MSAYPMPEPPTGATREVVLDRMARASNFASNGVAFAVADIDFPDSMLRTYINAARAMLDEAEAALGGSGGPAKTPR